MQHTENTGYDVAGMAMLELIWGKGFITPGGEGNVDRIVRNNDLSGKKVLELGSGIGGGAIVLAGKYGANVLGLEVEGPLVKSATENVAHAGLSDQVEFRLVKPGEFPVADESTDYFYTSGVLVHFKDKLTAFSEAFRLLKPGGMLLGYDWLAGTAEPGENIHKWLESAKLVAYPETLDSYTGQMHDAGFENIKSSDASDWYLERARTEYAQMTGALYHRMAELDSAESRDDFIEEWRSMLVVLESGELKSGYFSGRKSLL